MISFPVIYNSKTSLHILTLLSITSIENGTAITSTYHYEQGEWSEYLKDDAVKVLHSICQQMENSAVITGLDKVSFHFSPKEGNAKNAQTTAQLHSSHTLAK